MKVAKTNKQQIWELHSLLCEIEELSEQFRRGDILTNIDFSEFEIISNLPHNNIEEFLEALCHEIGKIHFRRILLNCDILLDNCTDPDVEYLEFHPYIKAGLELLKPTKE